MADLKIFPQPLCALPQLALALPRRPQPRLPLLLFFPPLLLQSPLTAAHRRLSFQLLVALLVADRGPAELQDGFGEVGDAVGQFPALLGLLVEALYCGPELLGLAQELRILEGEGAVLVLQVVVVLGGDEDFEGLRGVRHAVL